MKIKRRAGCIKGKIDIIPIVDVTLLLLLFFIPSSHFIFQSVVGVNLPKGNFSEVETQAHHTIIITKSELIFFDGKKVSEEGLNFGLELALSQGREPLVIIKADADVPYNRVVEIINLVKESGITRLGLATTPKE